MPRVMVSGCFDLLHSGHVAFLRSAAEHGDLHVCIGSDKTVHNLKRRWPINDQDERKYMLESLSCVHEVRISRGAGLLDFLPEMDDLKPDVFVVNEDGHTADKETLCRERGIRYLVLERVPYPGLQARSTTALRSESTIPFRIDLAGGWLDQPAVSKLHPGPVLTISIEPTMDFSHRSGMSTSTRSRALSLWGTRLPDTSPEHLAKVLFACENPPGTAYVSGSQDSIGIVYPGLNRLDYSGDYWPDLITSVHDEHVLRFLEESLLLVPLRPRESDFDVLSRTNLTAAGAEALASAAEACWQAILNCDLPAFGAAFRMSYEAQVDLFPLMEDDIVRAAIETHGSSALGYKLSGAGGGGYLILVQEQDIPGAHRIRIRRKEGH